MRTNFTRRLSGRSLGSNNYYRNDRNSNNSDDDSEMTSDEDSHTTRIDEDENDCDDDNNDDARHRLLYGLSYLDDKLHQESTSTTATTCRQPYNENTHETTLLDYEDARKWLQENYESTQLETREQFEQLFLEKSHNNETLRRNIPSNPEVYYGTEWISWDHFLNGKITLLSPGAKQAALVIGGTATLALAVTKFKRMIKQSDDADGVDENGGGFTNTTDAYGQQQFDFTSMMQSNAGAAPPPPPTGGGAVAQAAVVPSPPPPTGGAGAAQAQLQAVAQQMAVQAAANTASAAAATASATAAAATATASAASVGIASVAVAVSAIAVASVAAATAATASTRSSTSNAMVSSNAPTIYNALAPTVVSPLPSISQPPTQSPTKSQMPSVLDTTIFYDLPDCSNTTTAAAAEYEFIEQQKQLYVHFGGITRFLTPDEKLFLEETFVQEYNNLSTGCEDIYQRFLINAEIVTQSFQSGGGDNTTNNNDEILTRRIETANATHDDLDNTYLDTVWNIIYICSNTTADTFVESSDSKCPLFDNSTVGDDMSDLVTNVIFFKSLLERLGIHISLEHRNISSSLFKDVKNGSSTSSSKNEAKEFQILQAGTREETVTMVQSSSMTPAALSPPPSEEPTIATTAKPSILPSTTPTRTTSSSPSSLPTCIEKDEPCSNSSDCCEDLQCTTVDGGIVATTRNIFAAGGHLLQHKNIFALQDNASSNLICFEHDISVSPSSSPSIEPSSSSPSTSPTVTGSELPTAVPSETKSRAPSMHPSLLPSKGPIIVESSQPSMIPSIVPSQDPPSLSPSEEPTSELSVSPSQEKSNSPSVGAIESVAPTVLVKSSLVPSLQLSSSPSESSSSLPSLVPSESLDPSVSPSSEPSLLDSLGPSASSSNPSAIPSLEISSSPSESPSFMPSLDPSDSSAPSVSPSHGPSLVHSSHPSISAIPSTVPSMQPSVSPSDNPSSMPSLVPSDSSAPSVSPSHEPSLGDSSHPSISADPSTVSSLQPSYSPSESPSSMPSLVPSDSSAPSISPSHEPSLVHSSHPSISAIPSTAPSMQPSVSPSESPSSIPSLVPSDSSDPSVSPSHEPSLVPSSHPSISAIPSTAPSMQPSISPSESPSSMPSLIPSDSSAPSVSPSHGPSLVPSSHPSMSAIPSKIPSLQPSVSPSDNPSSIPSLAPSDSSDPSVSPSHAPSLVPSSHPSISAFPSKVPSLQPSVSPSVIPSSMPSLIPSDSSAPSVSPSNEPSLVPSSHPSISSNPSAVPSLQPTAFPSVIPSLQPSVSPSVIPSLVPSFLPSIAPSFCWGDSPMKLFFGKVNVTSDFKTIDLPFVYQKMVVVATPVLPGSHDTHMPVLAQVQNAMGASFDLRLFNPNQNLLNSSREVHYIVVEEGNYEESSGIKMSALTVSLTTSNFNANWQTTNMKQLNSSVSDRFATPVVLGQVMTVNDSSVWSTFWALPKSDNSNEIFVGKQCGAGSCSNSNIAETLGVIVVESGTNGTVADSRFITKLGGAQIAGVTSFPSSSYTLESPNSFNPVVAIASMSSMLGYQGGWVVLRSPVPDEEPITSSLLYLGVEEDQDRGHVPEKISYIIFEQNSC